MRCRTRSTAMGSSSCSPVAAVQRSFGRAHRLVASRPWRLAFAWELDRLSVETAATPVITLGQPRTARVGLRFHQ